MHLLVLERSMTKESILSETCQLLDSLPAERCVLCSSLLMLCERVLALQPKLATLKYAYISLYTVSYTEIKFDFVTLLKLTLFSYGKYPYFLNKPT